MTQVTTYASLFITNAAEKEALSLNNNLQLLTASVLPNGQGLGLRVCSLIRSRVRNLLGAINSYGASPNGAFAPASSGAPANGR